MPLLGSLSSIDGELSAQAVYITESALTTDEGTTVTFTILAEGIADGTTLYYTSTGTISNTDLSSGSLTGSFVLGGYSNTVVLTFSNDLATEGNETVQIQVRTQSTSGPIFAQSQVVTVIDTSIAPRGSALFVGSATPHTSSATNGVQTLSYWTVPDGVTSISIVCIGAGAGGAQGPTINPFIAGTGGGGGALSYRNNISVTPGETISIFAGRPANGAYQLIRGGSSYATKNSGFICGAQGGGTWNPSSVGGAIDQTPMTPGAYRMTNTTSYVSGSGSSTNTNGGGEGGTGGQWANTTYSASGGGGAGGYSGAGGQGGAEVQYFSGAFGRGQNGAGGGGGGGGMRKPGQAGGGGGTSPFGWDGTTVYSGGANTGGDGGGYAASYTGYTSGGGGKGYGGGAGGAVSATIGTRQGAPGCVRIVWPGISRQFPNTDVST